MLAMILDDNRTNRASMIRLLEEINSHNVSSRISARWHLLDPYDSLVRQTHTRPLTPDDVAQKALQMMPPMSAQPVDILILDLGWPGLSHLAEGTDSQVPGLEGIRIWQKIRELLPPAHTPASYTLVVSSHPYEQYRLSLPVELRNSIPADMRGISWHGDSMNRIRKFLIQEQR